VVRSPHSAQPWSRYAGRFDNFKLLTDGPGDRGYASIE
jgi:hypothetical protein